MSLFLALIAYITIFGFGLRPEICSHAYEANYTSRSTYINLTSIVLVCKLQGVHERVVNGKKIGSRTCMHIKRKK